jgi:zinc transport system substrate-binding protein
MKRRIEILLCVCGVLFGIAQAAPSTAADAFAGRGERAQGAPAVVASILPVHSLVAAVMAGRGTPRLLVRGAASPHDYALRPSDAQALQEADVVFWVGPGLEAFLAAPLRALATDARVVPLQAAEGVRLLPARAGGAWPSHDHAAEHAAEQGAGHDHAPRPDPAAADLHIWLDPANARAMVDAIVRALSAADPEHAGGYRAAGTAVQARLDRLAAEVEAVVEPVRETPYIVFHDGYHYFEARYRLKPVGAITLDAEQSPGAARLREIRARIADSGAACVFAEPQFEPAVVHTVTAGTSARTGSLDPLGATIEPGADAYFVLMRALARDLRACLLAAD